MSHYLTSLVVTAVLLASTPSPLKDIEELLDVDFVMKGGKVYKY